MGNSIKTNGHIYNKIQIELALSKAIHFVRLTRDRRIEALKKKESEILSKLEYGSMSMAQTYQLACVACRHLTFVKAANMILRHLDLLREHTIALEMAQSQPGNAGDLVPPLNTMIWGTYKLNIVQMEELVFMVEKVLGKKWVRSAMSGYMVDLNLRRNFAEILPGQDMVNAYLWDFVRRTSKGDEKRQSKLFC
jgi:hypothetical protein